MRRSLEEFGYAVLAVVVIAALITCVVGIKVLYLDKNKESVHSEFSEENDGVKAGGQGLADGDDASKTGEGYVIKDSNKEAGKLKTPDVMW